MKRKLLFMLCCPLFCGLSAIGQTKDGNNLSGQLAVPTAQTGHALNLTYAISEASKDLLSVSIQPRSLEGHVLSVRIVDKDDKVVMQLPEMAGDAAYVQPLSLASLPEGSYFIDLMDRGAKRPARISITKSNLSTNPTK
jgi:hypothetical protein